MVLLAMVMLLASRWEVKMSMAPTSMPPAGLSMMFPCIWVQKAPPAQALSCKLCAGDIWCGISLVSDDTTLKACLLACHPGLIRVSHPDHVRCIASHGMKW